MAFSGLNALFQPNLHVSPTATLKSKRKGQETMPVMILLVLLFVVWIFYERSKNNRVNNHQSDTFWNKELSSHTTRKKDISSLNLITVPMECLPFEKSSDPELSFIQEEIKKLGEQPIINLTGITNTDLRLNYGAPNFDMLSNADNNYIKLVRSLYKWGQLLYNTGQKEKSVIVLQFGIECSTEISANYTLLASIYAEQNQSKEIEKLIEKAQQLNTMTKASLIAELQTILAASFSAN